MSTTKNISDFGSPAAGATGKLGIPLEANARLQHIRNLDAIINSKLQELDQLKKRVESLKSPRFDLERIQLGSAPGGFAHSICKIIDYEREIDRQIDLYVDCKNLVDGEIRNLAPEEYTLLHMRFFCGMSWEKVAEKMNFSRRSIFNLRQNALSHYQGWLDRHPSKIQ